jgi:hypothetical protein
LGLKAVSPFDPVVSPFVVVVVVDDDGLVVVAVELVVEPPGTVVVVAPGSVGSGGKVTGRDTVGKVVVTQPTTTGRQSCDAAGALLVTAPARRMPEPKIPAAAAARAAVTSLWRRCVARGERTVSLFLSLM